MERLIKKVSKESWRELRAESIRHGMRMGEFLEYLLEEHKKNSHIKKGWEYIKNAKRRKMLSEKEAKKMKKAISVFEKKGDFEDI